VGDSDKVRWDLRSLGLSDVIIDAAWPDWWSAAAEASPSAQAELRFSLSRKLGLDPRSLLDDEQPRFVWRDEGKFKGLNVDTPVERGALVSFGAAVGRALVAAASPGPPLVGVAALELRASILRKQSYVRLIDLLALCWAVGVPTVHLRIFPLAAKRFAAMIVRAADRFAILLARDSQYPAPVAFYLAHEIGHAALGHIGRDGVLVDFADPLRPVKTDDEERAADGYALTLLTGMAEPRILSEATRYSAEALAQAILASADELHIEPGVMAMCFGHSTSAWDKAQAAMKIIYTSPRPVWKEVNAVAAEQMDWSALPGDMQPYLRALLGEEPNVGSGS